MFWYENLRPDDWKHVSKLPTWIVIFWNFQKINSKFAINFTKCLFKSVIIPSVRNSSDGSFRGQRNPDKRSFSTQPIPMFIFIILVETHHFLIKQLKKLSKNPNYYKKRGILEFRWTVLKVDRKSKKIICHLIDFGTCGPDDTDDKAPKDYGVTKPYLAGGSLCLMVENLSNWK